MKKLREEMDRRQNIFHIFPCETVNVSALSYIIFDVFHCLLRHLAQHFLNKLLGNVTIQG